MCNEYINVNLIAFDHVAKETEGIHIVFFGSSSYLHYPPLQLSIHPSMYIYHIGLFIYSIWKNKLHLFPLRYTWMQIGYTNINKYHRMNGQKPLHNYLTPSIFKDNPSELTSLLSCQSITGRFFLCILGPF